MDLLLRVALVTASCLQPGCLSDFPALSAPADAASGPDGEPPQDARIGDARRTPADMAPDPPDVHGPDGAALDSRPPPDVSVEDAGRRDAEPPHDQGMDEGRMDAGRRDAEPPRDQGMDEGRMDAAPPDAARDAQPDLGPPTPCELEGREDLDDGTCGPCAAPLHDDGLGRCVAADRCADHPEVAIAPGGFCVRIQQILTPEGWAGVWAHSALRLPDGEVTIAGGANAQGTQAAGWRFRPAADALVAAEPISRGSRSHAPLLRRDGTALLFMGDKTNATEGFGGSGENRTHLWDGAEWQENPPPRNRVARSHAAAVQLRAPDTRVVVVGGFRDGAPGPEVDLFDADGWTASHPLRQGRAAHQVLALPPPGLRVMAFGGQGVEGSLFHPEVIDLADPDSRWMALPHPDARGGVGHSFAGVATAADGSTYVAGGLYEEGARAILLRFRPHEMRWERLDDLPQAVGKASLSALPDGRLVLMGGGTRQDANGVQPRVWVYTPGGGWLESRPLLAARREHTATVLSDGRILVVGGYQDEPGAAVSVVEVHTLGR